MASQSFVMPVHSYIKGCLNNKPAVTRLASMTDKFPIGRKCFQKIRYLHNVSSVEFMKLIYSENPPWVNLVHTSFVFICSLDIRMIIAKS